MLKASMSAVTRESNHDRAGVLCTRVVDTIGSSSVSRHADGLALHVLDLTKLGRGEAREVRRWKFEVRLQVKQ